MSIDYYLPVLQVIAPFSFCLQRGWATRSICTLVLVILTLFLSGPNIAHAQEALTPQPPQCLVLAPSGHPYTEIRDTLGLLGCVSRVCASPDEIAHALRPNTVIVAPGVETSQLTPVALSKLVSLVRDGASVLIDGKSTFNMVLGVSYVTAPITIQQYRWAQIEHATITLATPATCMQFFGSRTTTVLADIPDTGQPVVLAGRYGAGAFLYTALSLNPEPLHLYDTLPFLLHAVVTALAVHPICAAQGLEYYMDWGFYLGVAPEQLIDRLAAEGVNHVHLSAWYDTTEFALFAYRFIAAAHARGIGVVSWFEFPMVSEPFWRQHPQWHEVTADGKDAPVAWRYHMALEDPACLEAVKAYMMNKLLTFDWDGVDIAELYFESPYPAWEHPELATPYYPAFRQQFREKYGADPLDIVNPSAENSWKKRPDLYQQWVAFRQDALTRVLAGLLQQVALCQQQKPQLGASVTIMDPLMDPAIRERLAIDLDSQLALRKIVPFTVQVEDPFLIWPLGPKRFVTLGEKYAARLGAETPFIININVIDRWQGTPMKRPAGLELLDWVHAAATHAAAVSLYAYNTVLPEDGELLPAVLASTATFNEGTRGGVKYQANRQCTWQVDTRGMGATLDGKSWPCLSARGVLLPSGVHTISLTPRVMETPAPRIEAISGTLLFASERDGGVEVRYRSALCCYITVNWSPTHLTVDGQETPITILGAPTRSVLALPLGTHTVLIR